MKSIALGITLAFCLAEAVVSEATAQIAPTSMEGEWTSDCLPIGKNDRHGTIIRLTIRDGVLDGKSQVFARADCQMPTVQVSFMGELVKAVSGDGPLDLDVLVKELTTTPNRPDVVEHYNRATEDRAGCGLTDWQVNRPTSTAGLTCGPFTWPKVGVHLYERAWVKSDELRFGAFPLRWSNTSPEKRPSEPSAVTFYRTGF